MASGLALRGFQAVPCSALPLFDRLTACLLKGVLTLKLPESQSAIEVIQRFPRTLLSGEAYKCDLLECEASTKFDLMR